MTQGGIWRSIRQYCIILTGCLIFALSIQIFYIGNALPTGGITGVALILHALLGLPIGTMFLLMNIPILYLGYRIFGLRFIINTLLATAVSSLFLDVAPLILPSPVLSPAPEPMLAAIYGGLGMGLGMGLVFFAGATTGGTDVLSRIVNYYHQHISLGKVILALDVLVIVLYGLLLGNLNAALYGLVAMFVSSKVIDGILYGPDNAKFACIISTRAEDISAAIIQELGRGVTHLSGRGGHSGQTRPVLLTAIKQNQIGKLKSIVYNIDPPAFVIVLTAQEVLGSGFNTNIQLKH